ncbi:MAG: ABC transporter ATP-binding protein [Methanomassiliicoccales archaeon]
MQVEDQINVNYTNAIEVKDMRYSYGSGKYAVDGITFSVEKGEIFGFLGRNGAGKTTTIKLLTTLIQPTSGEAMVLGVDVRRGGKQLRKRMGVVLQDESFDFTTVERALDIYGMMWGVGREDRKRRIEELLTFFELESERKKRLWDLSGGQKRRVQVAREFMHDMELLFLDEPTVGLDTVTRRKILDMVKEKAKEGLTVFFTTHNLEEADYLCDRVAIIDRGHILANDKVPQLKRSYAGLSTIEASFAEPVDRVLHVLEGIEGAKIEKPMSAAEPFKIVGGAAEELLKTIMERAVKAGLHISYLNIHPVTLEDVFLNTISG